MQNYIYTVINKEGKKLKGTLQAESPERARAMLRSQGFTIQKVVKETILTKELEITIGNQVKARDLSVFCRQFHSLLRAGVTVIDALDMLSGQTENKVFAKTLRECYATVQKGSSLTEAMKKHPKIFPGLLMNMVEAGEASGNLDLSFERMAAFFEKDAKLRALVKKAMIYPIMIMLVAFLVLIIMSVFIIPRFSKIFADMGAELPKLTLAVMNFSNFIIYRWYILVGAAIVMGVTLHLVLKTEQGKVFFARVAMKLPIFGKLTVKNASALFARTLATLTGAGVSLSEALSITARSMNNYLFRQALENARTEVIQGRSLNDPIRRCGLFPMMIPQMVRIGEETGNLEGMLEKSADYYEEEVEMATGNLTTMMEPLIIVVMGGIVGILVLALYMPIIQMYGTMG